MSGLRRGEIGGLRWSDIDFDRGDWGVLNIENNMVPVTGGVEEDKPKTEKSCRTLPLTRTLHDALKKAHKVQAAEKLALGKDYRPGTHVVCDETGKSYHPDTLHDYWIAICRKAKVSRIRLHDARHTCGTLMHLQGVPIAVIADWLGNVDNAFTMRTYVHSQNDEMFAAARMLDGLVTNRDRTMSWATRHQTV